MLTQRLIVLLSWAIRTLAEPSPLSIPPSEYWEGNDGRWSTFHVQIGAPGQTVRLLPGTSASAGAATWVVIPQGCTLANPNLTDCSEARGSLFASNLSLSYSTQGIPNGPDGALFELITYEESRLGLSGNAYYGFDSITLGIPGAGLPTLERQVVAGFATNDFWLGSLGLSPWSFNFTTLNDPQPSLMGNLRGRSLIPSSSWAYTAGAHYRDPPVYGSLTLGGYDRNRITVGGEDISVAFGADMSRDLLVMLASITYDTAGSSPLLAGGISIFINSLVTYMWLPLTVCRAFEQAFGLSWDQEAEMYLVDEGTHNALVAQNPTFTFAFGEDSGAQSVDIALPYAAFDLTASAPLVNASARYFPLKRAQNETQYTLGRVFLQEAYVIADYDRRQFRLMQAAFPSTAEGSDLVAVYPQDHEADGQSPAEDSETSGEHGLSGGAIAGLAVGVLAGVLLGAGLALWYFRQSKSGPAPSEEQALDDAAEKRSNGGLVSQPTEVQNTEIAEKDGDARFNEMDGKSHSEAKIAELADSKGGMVELPSPEVAIVQASELDSQAIAPGELPGSRPGRYELDGSGGGSR